MEDDLTLTDMVFMFPCVDCRYLLFAWCTGMLRVGLAGLAGLSNWFRDWICSYKTSAGVNIR